nr:hypothetical protein [Legionella jordanis]
MKKSQSLNPSLSSDEEQKRIKQSDSESSDNAWENLTDSSHSNAGESSQYSTEEEKTTVYVNHIIEDESASLEITKCIPATTSLAGKSLEQKVPDTPSKRKAEEEEGIGTKKKSKEPSYSSFFNLQKQDEPKDDDQDSSLTP